MNLCFEPSETHIQNDPKNTMEEWVQGGFLVPIQNLKII